MTAYGAVPLQQLMTKRQGSVNPISFPDEEFDLYSIPAFDRGEPEVLEGRDIGSTKQSVEPGDVLLSRIVPHIRRAWVVGPARGRRIIASGEWIVFRGENAHPDYLRHLFIGDHFHAQFMNTVAGVGGSLLRARPAHVAKISIPLPPLPEQKRIAAILDQADALRAKRRAALAKLDELTKSIFLDMFGDPVVNPKGWPIVAVADICEVKGGKRLPKGEEYSNTPTEFRYVRVSDLKDGYVEESGLLYLKPETQNRISRYIVRTGDVIISIAGSIGLVAPVPVTLNGANLTENAAKLVPRVAGRYEATYLAHFLSTNHAQKEIRSHVGKVTIGKLALFRIEKLQVLLPPIEFQREFVQTARAIHDEATLLHQAYVKNENLFTTLQHRAFTGTL